MHAPSEGMQLQHTYVKHIICESSRFHGCPTLYSQLFPPFPGRKPKYPVCFLTNGGGVTEHQKAEQLSGWLDVAVGVDQASLIDQVMPATTPTQTSRHTHAHKCNVFVRDNACPACQSS